MIFASPEAEARSLERAAARAGCRVRELGARETLAGVRAVGRVVCPDGWGAARLLVAAAAEDARTAGARDLALSLRRGAPSDEAFARAVHAYVKERVAFVPEQGEVFTGSAYTLATGAGDCDDHARLVYALASAGGIPASLAFLHHARRGAQPTHAVAVLGPGGRWSWAETTVDAAYGEHPLAAAARLGLVSQRGDLAREARIMSESDLPEPPAGYAAANPVELVARDAASLVTLGTLADAALLHAVDPRFRRAVALFQKQHPPLKVDGLIGPLTRAAIARALAGGTMGDVATGAARLTADLPDEFFVRLRQYAAELRFDPVWMLDVMFSESGIRSTAKYRNPPPPAEPKHRATGLIGFVDVARYGHPLITDNSTASHDLVAAQIGPVEQLRWARDFWRPIAGKATRAATLYQYAFLPVSIDQRGTSDETVLAAKGGTGYRGQEDLFYRLNHGYLDVDKDGAITVADLAQRLELNKKAKGSARYAEALARLGASPVPAPAPSSGGGAAAVAIALTSLAAVGLHYYA